MSEKNYQIVESLGIILLMTLFTIMGIHNFPLFLIVFPMLFIVYGVKYGIPPSLTTIGIVSLVIGYIVDIYIGLGLFLIFSPLAISIIYGIKRRKKSMEIIGVSALTVFLVLLLISGLIRETSGMSLVNQLEEGFRNLLNIQIELLKEMGQSNNEISNVKQFLEDSYRYVLLVLPALLIMFSIFLSYINYLLSTLTLRKMGIGVVHVPRFSRFRLPNNISAGVIVIFITMLFLRYINIPSYDAIMANLIVLFSFMFLIQGLSIVDFFLLKYKMYFIFRLIIIITLVFITPLVSIISILGLIDTFFDFRKIRNQRS